MSKLHNLSVPFNIPIPGGMCSGKMVSVVGNVPSMSQRFAVNLLTRSGDIALHLCPKFKENRVVRNNALNMNWGPEESNGLLPLYPGQNFEILILCEPYNFKIAFNGCHFCEFSHRLPFSTITNLAVDGEVVVHNVNFNDSNRNNNNTNGFNNSSYGFQSDPISNNYSSGGLYPSVDSYPYPSAPSPRSPSNPSVPQYPSSAGSKYPGSHYPSPGAPSHYTTLSGPGYPSAGAPSPYTTPSGPGYPSAGAPSPYTTPSGPGYPSTGGSLYPQNPSLYPTQPGYPSVPHQGPYPQVPNPNASGASPHSKPGFLDQAGAALAGVLGPSLLAGGMNRNSFGRGKPNLLDEAGKALAGVIGGGAGLAGTSSAQKGTQPQTPSHQPGFFDHAGTALAGILGGSGLMGGTDRGQRGRLPQTSTRQTQPGSILDQAGSALAGILGGGGLTGAGSSSRGGLPLSPARPPQSRLLDQAGSALAELLGGGGGLSGNRNNQRSVKFFQHRNHNKMGVLGGALGTAVAGAALTGHLNPIKATKKQLKAHKKALKYGLPIAGAGLGAYALHKGLKKGFRRSSSSSSSSSSD